MKIKLAILDEDQFYLNRIVSVFGTKYANNIELYSFTNEQIAMSAVIESKIDILLASERFEIDVKKLPKKCGFAYFVSSNDVESFRNQKAIGKFQRVDLIYKQILSIYSEISEEISGLKFSDDTARIISFSSIGGGTGASCMAAACAKQFAMSGKKTLYLNLEKVGSSDLYFTGEGQFNMSDVVFALRSTNSNISLKLESCVKQDPCGVYFYSESNVALDMYELKSDDIIRLLSEIRLLGVYDYIVLDLHFSLDVDILKIFKEIHYVVWVGDGSETSNLKIRRAYAALEILGQDEYSSLLNRVCLIYNKFSSTMGRKVDDLAIRELGGAPVYAKASVQQVVDELSTKALFTGLK